MGVDGRPSSHGREQCNHWEVNASSVFGLALRANFRGSDVVTFIGIPLRLLPPFTKVSISLIWRCVFSDFRSEMHGKEDGTIPATFQIIYMVCSIVTAPKRVPNTKRTDRMETLSKPTKTSREGIRYEEPQGCTLSLVRSTESPDAHSVRWDEGEKMFMTLPALALLRLPR